MTPPKTVKMRDPITKKIYTLTFKGNYYVPPTKFNGMKLAKANPKKKLA